MPTDTAPETTPDDTTADDAEGTDYGDVLADLDELTDRIADLERDERKRLRTEESLRAAKNGLMAALAASTPREFVLACSQACALLVAEAGAKSIAKSLRKTVQTFADATADVDPTKLLDLVESLGVDPMVLAGFRDAFKRTGKKAPCGASKCPGGPCPGGRCEAPAGGSAAPAEVVLRPVVRVHEYADRTEERVMVAGCSRESVRLTKSSGCYFIEAKTNAGVTFRGAIPSVMASMGREAIVSWDEESGELVLTFPREAVEEVSIEAPETTPPAEV